jgi:hypothetical protein
MAEMRPLMLLAFVVLTAIALSQIPKRASVSDIAHVEDVAHVEAGPTVARANLHPGHDPGNFGYHDPGHLRPMAFFALQTATNQAEPEPAAPEASAFVAADNRLYARDGARLRAAPSTAADVLTKLAADAPLHAVARSTDGAWWQVSLAATADQPARTGYVHQEAASKKRVATKKPPKAATPVLVATAQPAPARSSDGLLGTVDQTMTWLADAAARGSAPPAIRTER